MYIVCHIIVIKYYPKLVKSKNTGKGINIQPQFLAEQILSLDISFRILIIYLKKNQLKYICLTTNSFIKVLPVFNPTPSNEDFIKEYIPLPVPSFECLNEINLS